MCDLATAAAVIGVASAGAQYMGQRQQAKQQARYQAQASAAERQRALQEQRSVRMRQAQEQEATNRELADVALKSRAQPSRDPVRTRLPKNLGEHNCVRPALSV